MSTFGPLQSVHDMAHTADFKQVHWADSRSPVPRCKPAGLAMTAVPQAMTAVPQACLALPPSSSHLFSPSLRSSHTGPLALPWDPLSPLHTIWFPFRCPLTMVPWPNPPSPPQTLCPFSLLYLLYGPSHGRGEGPGFEKLKLTHFNKSSLRSRTPNYAQKISRSSCR